MTELHKNQEKREAPIPNEGQRGFLSSDKASLPCPSLSSRPILSKDTLDALEGLGDVLRSIHKRMASEGYKIVDGMIRKTEVH